MCKTKRNDLPETEEFAKRNELPETDEFAWNKKVILGIIYVVMGLNLLYKSLKPISWKKRELAIMALKYRLIYRDVKTSDATIKQFKTGLDHTKCN